VDKLVREYEIESIEGRCDFTACYQAIKKRDIFCGVDNGWQKRNRDTDAKLTG
jgi:hypothetical protein